jgi:membrane associated rhomboid family serine protease
MLRLHCRCGKKLKLADQLLGKAAVCPQCGKRVRVVGAQLDPERDRITGILVVEKGPARAGEQVYLGGKLAIEAGKSETATLRLAARSVRSRHALIIPSPYGWRIEEADSESPVLINGRRIRGHNLLDGDLVQLGEFDLRYLTDYTSSASRKLLKLESASAPAAAVPSPGSSIAAQEEALLAIADDDGSIAPLAVDSNADQFAPLELAEAAAPPAPRRAPPVQRDDDLYVFAPEEEAVTPVGKRSTPTPSRLGGAGAAPVGEIVCPSCGKSLGKRARICVDCGINVITGRPLVTATLTDVDDLYNRAQTVVSGLSWLFPIGLYPFASEAFGTRKPYAARVIFALNLLIGAIFLGMMYSGSPSYRGWRDVVLWTGDAPMPAERLELFYEPGGFGDSYAFQQARARIQKEQPTLDRDRVIVAAHESLKPEQQGVGRFHLYQLITNTFLHGSPLHFAGNMLFLLVFGTRVNALIGNLMTAGLYLVLAIAASVAHAISMQGQPPIYALGASGAVMGLAGMYFVLFPIHKVHIAAWWRWSILRGFHLSSKLFSVRGFWVVLAYISMDILATSLGAEDGVAHWAHLGGFAAGVIIAMFLLVARLADARGGDIFSAILGRRAWALIGKPGQ